MSAPARRGRVVPTASLPAAPTPVPRPAVPLAAESVSEGTELLFGKRSAPATRDDGAIAADAAVTDVPAPRRKPAAGVTKDVKRQVAGPLYARSWAWVMSQAKQIHEGSGDAPGPYVRASEVLAEIVAAAMESGLDVSKARSLEEVRAMAVRQFTGGEIR